MIALYLSSSLSLFICIVFGIFFAKVANISANVTEKVLFGLVVTNSITAILSIFVPINIYVLVGFLLGGIVLSYFIFDELKAIYISLKQKKYIVILAIPIIIVASLISIAPPQNYDTGLYHLQFIKWIEQYAIVPGLANLHGRFGFNSNIFLFFALTSLFEVFKQEIFSVNFTLFSIFVMYFLNKLYFIFRKNGITNIFVFNFVVLISILGLKENLSSPSPDFISIALPLFILSSCFEESKKDEIRDYMLLLVLCIFVVTVKLAALPIMIMFIAISVKFRSYLRRSFMLYILCSLVFVPWLIRNIILSGWLIYPFPLIDLFNFDWKVPISNVIAEKIAVTGWARNPSNQFVAAAHMNIFDWFPQWWNRLIHFNKLLLVLSIISPLIAYYSVVIKKIRIEKMSIFIIITSFVGVLFWLSLAPDFRFGKAFIIVSAFSPLLYIRFKLNTELKGYYISIVVLCVIVFIAYRPISFGSVGRKVVRIVNKKTLYVVLPEIWEKPKGIDFDSFNMSGLKIFKPITGDQCFDHCLPCTPYPDSTVILRGNEVQYGFMHKVK